MREIDKDDKQIRVAVYLRVSTEDQVEKFGIEMQKESILTYFKSRGKFEDGRDKMVLAGEDHIYLDDGVSGTKDIDERKDFGRLIENIQYAPDDAKPFDAVAVYKVDRLARKLSILLKIIDIFDHGNVQFISVNESIDTSTPFGMAILSIMGVIAQLEIETTRLRTSGGRVSAKLGGKYGSTPPYGYSKNLLGHLEILENEAKHIRDMFSWCVFEGKTTREISQLLESQKVISPAVSMIKNKKRKGEVKKLNNDYFWKNETIRGILSNDIYIGYFRFGKTKEGKAVPREDWMVSEHKIPSIIEDAVFYEAQKKLKDSASKVLLNRKRNEDRLYLLSGLIKCGWCEKHSKGLEAHAWNGNKKEIVKGSHEYSYYYKCSHKNTRKYDQICPTIPVPAEQLESYVIAFIKKLLSNPEVAFEHQQRLKSNQLQVRQLRAERITVTKKINELPKRRANLSVQHEVGLVVDDEMFLRLKELKNERNRLDTRLKVIGKLLGQQVMSDGYIKSFAEYAKRYSKALDDIVNNKDEIYTLLHSLIDEIIVYSRLFDPVEDKIAGRRKENQQIPNSVLIKLKLPGDLLNELITQQIKHITEFAVRTDML